MRRPIILATILLAVASSPSAKQPTPAVRALFIGNSLTYANNLPAMIEAVAASAGLKGRVVCRGIALPDFGLQEHWDQGDALRGIRNSQWTHVVLQQGPSSQPDSRVILREFTKRFAFEVKAKGAKVVLYSTWTSRNRLNFMDDVVESYRLASEDVGGMLVPVGEGWRAAWSKDPSLPLYAEDQFHPSPMGTYLAALMFFQHLTGKSAIGLPAPDSTDKALRGVRLDAVQLKIVQEAAALKGWPATAAGAAK